MISCVTFETYKVFNPVKYYETQIIHIIHYVRNMNSENDRLYQAFYDRVCDLIRNYNPNCEIVEHIEDVTNFQKMLRTVDSIIKEEYEIHPRSDIFINISAGTSEYVAAATISSMMFKEAIPFSVKTSSYTVSGEERVKEAYYEGDLPIGMTKTTFDPTIVPKISIKRPDERLVKGLRILRDTYDKNPNSRASEIIDNLKKEGVWMRGDNCGNKTDESRYNLIQYHRDFVDKWELFGWVIKDSHRHKYYITQEGERVVFTFNG